jgi:hypothetical protein
MNGARVVCVRCGCILDLMVGKRLVGVVALAGCVGGCATTGGKVTAIIGAATAVSAVVVAANSACGKGDDAAVACLVDGEAIVGLGLLTGVAFFASMVFEIYGAPPLAPAPPQRPEQAADAPSVSVVPPTIAIAARDPRAEQLTRQAVLAARVGHCYTVGALGTKVRAIDPGYYDRVFASDPTIASCR